MKNYLYVCGLYYSHILTEWKQNIMYIKHHASKRAALDQQAQTNKIQFSIYILKYVDNGQGQVVLISPSRPASTKTTAKQYRKQRGMDWQAAEFVKAPLGKNSADGSINCLNVLHHTAWLLNARATTNKVWKRWPYSHAQIQSHDPEPPIYFILLLRQFYK